MSPLVRLIVVALLAAALLAGAPACGMRADTERPSQAASDTNPGSIAYVTMEQFSETVGPRPSESWGAIEAREFILHAFQQYGYEPTFQEFIAGEGDERVQSANIVAVKPGESGQTLVVGAHYDSKPGSAGASDNASGVAVLIEMAARLAEVQTPYTLAFVAFGAEEEGLYGSLHYLEELDDTSRGALLGMINLDGVAGGDVLYSYGVEADDSWLQRDVLAAAEELGVELATDAVLQVTPPVSRGRGYQVAGDHIPFAGYGVPATGFITADSDLSTGKAAFRPMNTKADTMATMEKDDPGRAQRQLRDLVRVLELVLTSELAQEV